MDINENIKQQLQENPILLYMKGTPQAPSAASPPRRCRR